MTTHSTIVDVNIPCSQLDDGNFNLLEGLADVSHSLPRVTFKLKDVTMKSAERRQNTWRIIFYSSDQTDLQKSVIIFSTFMEKWLRV